MDNTQALRMAYKTRDAYSANAFGSVRWVQATQMLFDLGLTSAYVEAVLRSKYTRWCRDASNGPSEYVHSLETIVKKLKVIQLEELL